MRQALPRARSSQRLGTMNQPHHTDEETEAQRMKQRAQGRLASTGASTGVGSRSPLWIPCLQPVPPARGPPSQAGLWHLGLLPAPDPLGPRGYELCFLGLAEVGTVGKVTGREAPPSAGPRWGGRGALRNRGTRTPGWMPGLAHGEPRQLRAKPPPT